MAFAIISSPRRLAILSLIVFVTAIIFLQSSEYRTEYLPKTPGFAHKGEEVPDTEHFHQFQPKPHNDPWPNSPDETIEPFESGSPDQTSHDGGHDDIHEPVDSSSTPSVSSASLSVQPPGAPKTQPSHPDPTHLTPTIPPLQQSFGEIQDKIKQLNKEWTPPSVWHYPPYDGYVDEVYNPNLWESFDWENDFYIQNGIKKFNEGGVEPVPYSPYPDYNGLHWKTDWKGKFEACMGPRGKRYNESTEDILKAYPKLPDRFPSVAAGDVKVTGIDHDYCFDRYQRYGPYGLAQTEGQTATDWDKPETKVDWSSVRWGKLQDQCLVENGDRYSPVARQPPQLMSDKELPNDASDSPEPDATTDGKQYHPRTAVLMRSWEGYEYTEDSLLAMRALISELSLQSGGEYHVFLFVNIKDRGTNLYTDKANYDRLVRSNVPKEFEDITILWSEQIFPKWYPDITDWQVYWHQFMCLQWFSKTHPEFDYVWNWEVDARYIGSHYQFLEAVADHSKMMPRKYLWERNSRLYIPSAHGIYKDWLADTDAEIEAGIEEGTIDPVWGPRPFNESAQKPIGPKAPSPMVADAFEWGVGEEADLITLLPIWDPAETEWTMKEKIWNFVPGVLPHFTPEKPMDDDFTHPAFAKLPRRAYINTLSRFSKRLLHAMHLENVAGRTMQSEMWPATAALHHGLKAVYAPHPIWADRKWPAWYADAVFNANDNRTARWGAQADSPYNQEREHNFGGWSWYYATDFPRVLYRRWLGWVASVGVKEQFPNNPLRVLGGEEYEMVGKKVKIPPRKPDGSQAAPPGGQSFGGTEVIVGGNGRMCLPPMLLHPVKDVVEGVEQDM